MQYLRADDKQMWQSLWRALLSAQASWYEHSCVVLQYYTIRCYTVLYSNIQYYTVQYHHIQYADSHESNVLQAVCHEHKATLISYVEQEAAVGNTK